jgi:general secretion pathway protein N
MGAIMVGAHMDEVVWPADLARRGDEMIRLGVVLGLAAGFIAFDAPGMSALGAMDSMAGNRGDPTDGDGPGLRSNPLWAIPLSSLSATRERPLFSSSRRPPPVIAMAPPAPRVVPPPPKAEEPDHPPLTVVGTVSSEAGGIGVFLDQTTNNIIRLKVGQDHMGWILRSIQGREASFEKDQRTTTLSLPSRSSALSPANPTLAMGQAGATWTDGRRATDRSAVRDDFPTARRFAWFTFRFGVRRGTGGYRLDGWRRSADHTAVRDNVAIDGGFVRRGTSGLDLDGRRRAADRPARENVAVDGGFADDRLSDRSKRKLIQSRRAIGEYAGRAIPAAVPLARMWPKLVDKQNGP